MGRFLIFMLLNLITTSLLAQDDEDWTTILNKKEGTVTFYWYPNNISISSSKDILDGVEHELALSFVQYLETKYKVDLELEWEETKSFNEVLDIVRNKSGASFGSSSISITEERRQYLNFTPPYLSDISVLISNSKIPIAQGGEEFREVFQNMTAVTIPNTTYITALEKLEDDLEINFDYEYVENSGQIIEKIENLENGFGYIDLSNFLVALDNSSTIRRQFFYPLKLDGIAMVYPKNSDWESPVTDYFSSEQFLVDKERIVVKYLGEGATNIIDRIATSAEIGPYEEIIISNREKDLQYQELLEASRREQERRELTNILILGITIVVMLFLAILVRFRIKTKANLLLTEKNETIADRNKELKKLNDEKNDLINILAHDLRSPLSNILNISLMFKENPNLTEEDKKLNSYVTKSSQKMASMITKILDVDAIESGKRNLVMERFNLSEVVVGVLRDYESKANKKGIKVNHDVEEVLIVFADRFYTNQVIDNLLSNAIKYSEPQSEVTVNALIEDGAPLVHITDQGPGFSEEDQKNLFKKFHRLSAQPTAGEETVGLGLSIVKSYVDMIRADISYVTIQGEGTTFTVRFQS
ncbi:MAG: ATP-binding protein [bacterium]|nr:ATP-binding protein [bacterium]